MTGKQAMEAAFSPEGPRAAPAVVCYEGIYTRDHWDQLSEHPWWFRQAPEIERQIAWRRDAYGRTGQDWFRLPFGQSRSAAMTWTVEGEGERAWRVDRSSGERTELRRPRVAGWWSEERVHSYHPVAPPDTPDEIDALLPLPEDGDARRACADGRDELAQALMSGCARDLWPICHVASPFWRCYSIWGFEGMMTRVVEKPELVVRVCRRRLAQAICSVQAAALLGARGIWVEECMTDMVSPDVFAAINLPVVRALTDAIRQAGMFSIYYYCGDPGGKWDSLLAAGADALSFEESKKGFTIDIEDVVERVAGRCTVLGNLDAIGVLQDGSEEELKAEIRRQIRAGRRNGSRFVMSLGSPVTPSTPVSRVRRYCDLVHELGAE